MGDQGAASGAGESWRQEKTLVDYETHNGTVAGRHFPSVSSGLLLPKKKFWNPAYKFRAFGGPLEIVLGTLGVICILLAVWACLRRKST